MSNIIEKQKEQYILMLKKEIKNLTCENNCLHLEVKYLRNAVREAYKEGIIFYKDNLKGNISNVVKKAKNELLGNIEFKKVSFIFTDYLGTKNEIKATDIRGISYYEGETLVVNSNQYSPNNIMIKI